MLLTIKNLRWTDLSILGLTLIVMVMGIGNYSLYEPHEGHFAMVGQEMLWQKDWIVPHLNGSPYLNKPPLLYWLVAASTHIFGSTEFAARLPISLSGWLGIVVAWQWTRELWGITSSRITALMLSVTLGWFIFTHQILIDVLLGTLLLSSSYFLWKSLYQPRSWFNWLGTYTSIALCVLTKGFIGGVFPLLGCLALISIRQDWKIIRRIKLLRGLLLVLAIVLPWFIAIERANPGFLHYFVVNEHLDRLLDRRFPPDYEVSKISAIGYLAMTACWCFPWILFLPSVTRFTWKEWRRGCLTNSSFIDRKNSDGVFLLGIGTILPVVLFLPLSSRLIYYSIPAIPPYIILCAGWWDKHRHLLSRKRKLGVVSLSAPRINFNTNYSSALGILSQSTLQVANYSTTTKSLNLYGAIAIVLGIVCFNIILILPAIFNVLPEILRTTEIIKLIVAVAIVLGIGSLVTGIGMFKRSALAWLPLFVAMIITYIAIIRGFTLYQDIRSSESLIERANVCLNSDTQWIFEGSREIGAAGAISYYLNQNSTIEPGSLKNSYRTVMVLADGGENRLPPQFPGSTPEYLITKKQLQKHWYGDRPVAFLTDFLRQPNNINDPENLNLPQTDIEPYTIVGPRKLYLNQAALEIARKHCS